MEDTTVVKERAREQEIQRKENLLINIRVPLSITSVLGNGCSVAMFRGFSLRIIYLAGKLLITN
jgi:hypothetical protein